MMSSRSSHRLHDEEPKDSAPLNDSRANANETHAAGAATLRRLSRAQADRTIRDLTPYETNLVYHLDTIRFATRTQLSRLQPGSGSQAARCVPSTPTCGPSCRQSPQSCKASSGRGMWMPPPVRLAACATARNPRLCRPSAPASTSLLNSSNALSAFSRPSAPS